MSKELKDAAVIIAAALIQQDRLTNPYEIAIKAREQAEMILKECEDEQ